MSALESYTHKQEQVDSAGYSNTFMHIYIKQ